MAGLVTLTGGTFQDAMGNLLSDGYLICELSQDEQLSSSQGQAVGGRKIKVLLGTDGNVLVSPAQNVWPTDEMNPANASYTVWGYSAEGQLVWGPNYGLLVPTGSTYNVDGWVPNQIGSGGSGAPVGSLLLQTNGVNNGSQQLLNLVEGGNVTITDDDAGNITIAANSGGQKGPRPAYGAWHYWNAYAGGGSSVISSNTMELTGAGTASIIAPTTTETGLQKFTAASGTTASVGLNESWLYSATIGVITLPLLVDCQLRVLTPLATSAGDRYWIGLCDYTASSPIGGGVLRGNNPVSSHAVAFRYSPGTDTHWVAYVGNSSSQTIVDTGITPDTSASHLFEIQISGSNALFMIDGTLVATISVSGLTNLFWSFATADNQLNHSAAAATVQVAYMYWESSL